MRLRFLLLMLTVSLWAANGAVVVTPTVTSVAGGFEYDYTVANSGTLGIIRFQLTLSSSPTSVAAPTDWIFNTFVSGGDTLVEWASASEEIASGASLAGFVLLSPYEAVPVAVEFMDSELNLDFGTTEGPGAEIGAATTATPEPGTFALAALFTGALPFALRWRKRKAQ